MHQSLEEVECKIVIECKSEMFQPSHSLSSASSFTAFLLLIDVLYLVSNQFLFLFCVFFFFCVLT